MHFSVQVCIGNVVMSLNILHKLVAFFDCYQISESKLSNCTVQSTFTVSISQVRLFHLLQTPEQNGQSSWRFSDVTTHKQNTILASNAMIDDVCDNGEIFKQYWFLHFNTYVLSTFSMPGWNPIPAAELRSWCMRSSRFWAWFLSLESFSQACWAARSILEEKKPPRNVSLWACHWVYI